MLETDGNFVLKLNFRPLLFAVQPIVFCRVKNHTPKPGAGKEHCEKGV